MNAPVSKNWKRNSESLRLARRAHLLRTLFFVAALATSSAARAEDCLLRRLTSLDLRMETSGLVSVPVGFAGRDLFFIVDTGGAYSTVSATIAAERQLSPTPASLPMRMLGGVTAQ